MLSRLALRLLVRLRRSPDRAFALCAGATLLLGVFDAAIAFPLELYSLYLIPIVTAARFASRRAALSLCLLSAACWRLGQALRPVQGRAGLGAWGCLARAGAYALVALVVSGLIERARRRDGELRDRRARCRDKREMLSLVNHELANALTMIGIAVKSLEDTDGTLGADRAELWAVIERNVSRLGLVAQNFLSEARRASGHFELRRAPTRLDELVRGVVATLKPLAEDKSLRVTWRVRPEELTASVDRDALAVVFSNLIGNAIKYTPAGGRVAVDVRGGGGRPVDVAVSDSGIGMTRQEQACVTAGFQRTELGRGTASGFGLGLKLVDDMVRRHGGSLSIASVPGKGSRFSFSLPSMR